MRCGEVWMALIGLQGEGLVMDGASLQRYVLSFNAHS